jgi:hypothetical protein
MASVPDRTVNGAPMRTSNNGVQTTRGRIPELSGIEFRQKSDIEKYGRTLRGVFRDLSFEIEYGSAELYAVLSRQSGHPLLFGLDTRLRARRVCKRLDRLAVLMGGGCVESVAFVAEFRRQFEPAIAPRQNQPKARKFDWDN